MESPERTDVTFRPPTEDDLATLALLRSRCAAADRVDPLSTLESLPTAADLRALADGVGYFCVVRSGGNVAGYGFLRSWTEADDVHVVLCDWYRAAGFPELDGPVLAHLEERALARHTVDGLGPRTVLGANASSVQPRRSAAIRAAGYAEASDVVEMERRGLPVRAVPAPHGLELRKATVDDAAALVDLTRRAWAGRAYFTIPTVAEFDSWLRRSDLGLFDVAVADGRIVAFVAGVPRRGSAEIDDVQVDPRFHRRGVATALVAHTLRALAARGFDVVRLHTEGRDPAGARSLYETLGFRVVRSHVRYRKPLTGVRP